MGSWMGEFTGKSASVAALPTIASTRARRSSPSLYASTSPMRESRYALYCGFQRMGFAPSRRYSSGRSDAVIWSIHAFTPSAYARTPRALADVESVVR